MTIASTLTKAQATGNDFLMFADPDGSHDPQPGEIARICDRHFGIGADGIIRVTRPQYVRDLDDARRDACRKAGAEWFMDYRNADGSIAQMCGNGARATALFIKTQGLADMPEGQPLALGTRAGVKLLTPLADDPQLGDQLFRVDMGKWTMGEADAYAVSIPDHDGQGRGTFVDMGNPHVVTVVEDAFSTLPVLDQLDLTVQPDMTPRIGEGQNVEFVRVDDIDASSDLGEASMRVHERGCGETLSCGSGLCATAVVLRAKTGIDHWVITVRGGVLRIDVTDDSVMLTGAAHLVAAVTLLQ
ncbi:diaminopimelate epimerase [Bifidobacterium cuniculi]|nr:diaminopimelate epimerase [Bifidobacterium cuniculi]